MMLKWEWNLKSGLCHFIFVGKKKVEGNLWTSVSFKNICAADNDNYKRRLDSSLKIQGNCR